MCAWSDQFWMFPSANGGPISAEKEIMFHDVLCTTNEVSESAAWISDEKFGDEINGGIFEEWGKGVIASEDELVNSHRLLR